MKPLEIDGIGIIKIKLINHMKNKNSGKRWNDKERDKLKQMAKKGNSTLKITKDLGRSIGAITGQASTLKISLLPVDK